uniref:Uncharacterized protein n=1 Tax=Candidatus Kentrum sp. FW TaxID=2126338 RepID=A0A450TIK6_9GAMM|nr:MAG: hypothetical protein BECKFW1821C_GA0114237_101110 [Candidatus Kentron sp. FW]
MDFEILGDVNTIYNRINHQNPVDLTPAISRIAHAFLPPVVFQLEEYGIPRMISRKIHSAGVIDLENRENDIHDTIGIFQQIGYEGLLKGVRDLDGFDKYILQYFYEGILPATRS